MTEFEKIEVQLIEEYYRRSNATLLITVGDTPFQGHQGKPFPYLMIGDDNEPFKVNYNFHSLGEALECARLLREYVKAQLGY